VLYKIDSEFGHIIEDTPAGPVYQDDGSPVDPARPRPCAGCSAAITPGSHDPCIANLPGAYQACCGHGLERSPVHGNPAGYVGLRDGRSFRFSGRCGGERIRQATDAALKGDPLPEGFSYDEERSWWEGLTDQQVAYVRRNIPRGLARLVSEATDGAPLSDAITNGEKFWADGLSEEQKGYVMANMRAMLSGLVQEALAAS
jgi:hypothetical protein